MLIDCMRSFIRFLGIGQQFDVVELPRRTAFNDLLLPRKGVYASPFDLKYYEQKKNVTYFILSKLALSMHYYCSF